VSLVVGWKFVSELKIAAALVALHRCADIEVAASDAMVRVQTTAQTCTET
jgi:hypothetical protein